ncbi:MAG: transposase domain-containing protein [Verrucomicrobia bacterium]|nr:transposase domain-containing protein [Verrucomicrobiota bacterium]
MTGRKIPRSPAVNGARAGLFAGGWRRKKVAVEAPIGWQLERVYVCIQNMLTLEQQHEIQSRNAVLEHQLETSKRTTREQEQLIAERDHRIEKLKWEIAALKRKLFGGKQGETVSDEQLQLALAELEAERRELDHPQTRIDNNLTEQSIRPCKLGAKNWLFIGHPRVGHRSAVIYTLIESCKRHAIEPQAYFTDILTRLPSMTNPRPANLTPDKWKVQGI